MVDLSLDLGKGLKLKNPVLTASGTFGYGIEFADFINLDLLGGFIVKGTTLEAREGNPYPRMAETEFGMLNSVGLQNKGVNIFVNNIYQNIYNIYKRKSAVIVNVSGSTIDDYVKTAEKINDLEYIPAIELNISCPNVKEGGMAFGTSCKYASKVVNMVRKVYSKHLMVKLTPNVTDIVSIAKSVEDSGADSVSLVNTFLGMAIDIYKRKPKLANIMGGYSGPAIKPIALRMVYQVANALRIPVCGLGGIMNADDAIEFLLAGASCIQVGTANFINPKVTIEIIQGIENYCIKNGFTNIKEVKMEIE